MDPPEEQDQAEEVAVISIWYMDSNMKRYVCVNEIEVPNPIKIKSHGINGIQVVISGLDDDFILFYRELTENGEVSKDIKLAILDLKLNQMQ